MELEIPLRATRAFFSDNCGQLQRLSYSKVYTKSSKIVTFVSAFLQLFLNATDAFNRACNWTNHFTIRGDLLSSVRYPFAHLIPSHFPDLKLIYDPRSALCTVLPKFLSGAVVALLSKHFDATNFSCLCCNTCFPFQKAQHMLRWQTWNRKHDLSWNRTHTSTF